MRFIGAARGKTAGLKGANPSPDPRVPTLKEHYISVLIHTTRLLSSSLAYLICRWLRKSKLRFSWLVALVTVSLYVIFLNASYLETVSNVTRVPDRAKYVGHVEAPSDATLRAADFVSLFALFSADSVFHISIDAVLHVPRFLAFILINQYRIFKPQPIFEVANVDASDSSEIVRIPNSNIDDLLAQCRKRLGMKEPQLRASDGSPIASDAAFREFDAFHIVDGFLAAGTTTIASDDAQDSSVLTAGPAPYPILGNIPHIRHETFDASFSL